MSFDSPAQQAFQVQLQSAQIHEAAARFEIHQEVDVALRVVLTSGNGSEDPEVPRATLGGPQGHEDHFTAAEEVC
jgi:hypothetical protein